MLLAMGALACVLLLFLSAFLVVDGDLFHEMALARAVLSEGSIPREDHFAYTPTVSPSVHHEWGMGMVLYAATLLGGTAGVVALKYLLGFGVVALSMAAARTNGAGWEITLFMTALMIPMADIGFTNVRAQFFSMLFLATLLLLLARDRHGGRRWIIPWLVAYVLWLNLHAGFIVGLILLGCHWVERWLAERRLGGHLLIGGGLMLALVLVNPYGVSYPRYLSRALLMERPQIMEWQPIWASPPHLTLFLLSLLFAVLALRRGISALPGWLVVLVFAGAAIRHVRHLSLYAVVWMAYVPAWLEPTSFAEELRGGWRRHRRAVAALCVILGVGALGVAISREPWRLRVPANRSDLDAGAAVVYPAGAVAYMEETGFRGNVLTPFVEGSFVIWYLHPDVRVGLDGRYEVAYREGVTEEILAFYAAQPGWRETLGRYPTDLVLVRPTDPVRGLLESLDDWRAIYRDDVFLLFARAGIDLPTVDRRGRQLPTRFP
jgi:hypothetical protein